ncbi:MAG: hypothetical protein KUG65_11015 [Sphingomonadaceae bacterium]|nr:hypothetical protein [Sphingomonadaceae bacterium]
MTESIGVWATAVFDEAFRESGKGMARKQAGLAKRNGLQQSGIVTALGFVYMREGERALTRCLDGIPRRVQGRGKLWKEAIKAVDGALNEYLDLGTEAISKRTGGQYRDLIETYIEDEGVALKLRLSEFGNEWTAPEAKGWHELNPIKFQLLIAMVGFLLGILATVITTKWIEPQADRVISPSASSPCANSAAALLPESGSLN